MENKILNKKLQISRPWNYIFKRIQMNRKSIIFIGYFGTNFDLNKI